MYQIAYNHVRITRSLTSRPSSMTVGDSRWPLYILLHWSLSCDISFSWIYSYNHFTLLHRVPKKEATELLAITFSNLNRFAKFFHCRSASGDCRSSSHRSALCSLQAGPWHRRGQWLVCWCRPACRRYTCDLWDRILALPWEIQ